MVTGGVSSGMMGRDCGWNPSVVNLRVSQLTIKGVSGRRESLPNRFRLLLRGGGEGCTVVQVGHDVTGGS